MSRRSPVDLGRLASEAIGRAGVVWTLQGSEDLNANLVRFGPGGGVGDHTNDEVDVVFVGVSGTGTVEVDGEAHYLGAGVLVFVRKGVSRSTRATSDDFAYLTLHKRRGPLGIGTRGV